MISGIRSIRTGSSSEKRTLAPRSARFPRFIGAQPDAANRLDSVSAAIIGCGSIGSNIAIHLSRLQVARLLLVDRANLKPESMLTHPAHPETISRPKASTIGNLCKRISPATQVRIFDGPVERLPLTAFEGYDRIILATDNLLAEVEVSQRCLWLGLPLTQVSVHGDTLVSHIRSLSGADPEGPCLVCAFSPAERSALNNETWFSCEGAKGGSAAARTEGLPTVSTSFLCSTAADLAMIHIVRQELSLGSRETDVLVEFCGYNFRTVISPLVRNPECGCEHSLYRRISSGGRIADTTPRELVRMAGYGARDDLEGISLRVDRMVYCERGACRCVGGTTGRRFYPIEGRPVRCRRCGMAVKPQIFFTHDPVPAVRLVDGFDRPLRKLGAGSARSAIVRGPRGNALITAAG